MLRLDIMLSTSVCEGEKKRLTHLAVFAFAVDEIRTIACTESDQRPMSHVEGGCGAVSTIIWATACKEKSTLTCKRLIKSACPADRLD